MYIDSTQWHADSSQLTRIRDHWRELVEAQGAQWRRPGVQTYAELDVELQQLGGQVETVEVLRYQATATPRERLDQFDLALIPYMLPLAPSAVSTVWARSEYPVR